jgi:formylglycine-generating enzyme required for sulfatase activity
MVSRLPDEADGSFSFPVSEPDMILVPAGEFVMGAEPKHDAYTRDRERPQHTLMLADFHIARTPVTNAEYAAFVQATDHPAPACWTDGDEPDGKADHPVVQVTWYDAMAYGRWLSECTGQAYRLPSEAEWEKAARGSDGRLYPWGDAWDPSRCNTKESGIGDTTPVTAYSNGASPYGVLGMAGNVFEWTLSLWGTELETPDFVYPYDPRDGREDQRARNGVLRVIRGGGFYYAAPYARTTCRLRSYPDYGVKTRGFRLAIRPAKTT